MENLQKLQPEIKIIPAKKAVYATAFGDYNKSAGIAWEKVCGFAAKNNLFGPGTEFIGISHGDPNVTEAEKLQYDACVVIQQNIETEAEIGVQEIQGGKYAVFKHKGSYKHLNNSYNYIFGQWLAESEEELRNIPCYEKYLNSPDEVPEDDLLTEFYIPIL